MRVYFTLISLLLFSLNSKSQAPLGIPYQSVVRNSSGNIVANQSVTIRFSIHDSSLTGSIVYQETHSPTTNAFGQVSLTIGLGIVSTGIFAAINWAQHSKFLQVELDVTGGTTYIDMGTTQLMSVPFALYANTASSTKCNGCYTCPTEISQVNTNYISYPNAVLYCRDLIENGHNDWRLPTIDECDYLGNTLNISIPPTCWTNTWQTHAVSNSYMFVFITSNHYFLSNTVSNTSTSPNTTAKTFCVR